MRSVFSTLLQRSIQDCFRLIESNSPGYIRKPLNLVECFCIEPARPAVSAQMGRPSNLVNPQDSRCKKKPTVQVQAKKTNPAPRQRVHRNVNLQRAMRFMGLTESGVVQIDDSDGESVPSIASDLHMLRPFLLVRATLANWSSARRDRHTLYIDCARPIVAPCRARSLEYVHCVGSCNQVTMIHRRDGERILRRHSNQCSRHVRLLQPCHARMQSRTHINNSHHLPPQPRGGFVCNNHSGKLEARFRAYR